MTKIFDCFLYNGEDNLLEIRLNYLEKYVDFFVIVESCQTFQGKIKKFRFNKKNFFIKKFIKKIIYLGNDIVAENIYELRKKIATRYPDLSEKLNSVENFYKKDFVWYLDSFHREIIYEAIKDKIKKNDVIMLSDIDEIPSYKLLSKKKFNKNVVNVLVQNEFRYFYNTFVLNDWKGTVITKWELAKKYGLNNLRYLAKKKYKDFKYISQGGYHFSSMGPKKNILRKIKEWSHKEFNNFIVKFFMITRYNKGLDIFFINKNQFQIVQSINSNLFDEKMSSLIEKQNTLIRKTPFRKKNLLDDSIFYLIKFFLLFFKIKRRIISN